MSDILLSLFPGEQCESACITRAFSVVKKHGTPLLFLPKKTGGAVRGLDLYPAQRRIARISRALLRCAFRVGAGSLLEETSVSFSSEHPFAQFLGAAAETKQIPTFAILAGNPNAAGRRFVLLVFDDNGNPTHVVKVGCGEEPIGLIQREKKVLLSARNKPGVPALLNSFENNSMQAISLRFYPGKSPDAADENPLADLLRNWIDRSRMVDASVIPAWSRLKKRCSNHPVFQSIQPKLELAHFHPVLFHGDFAAWNIKVSPADGTWLALDWERGDLAGFPAWDWFHYEIQNWILVRRLTQEQIAIKVEDLLNEQKLLDYAHETSIAGCLHELFLAYLLYCVEVIGPSEGLKTTRELLNSLSNKWHIA